MDRKKRKKERGYLFVVGGPGGSGSSIISKMLSKHFQLTRMYAGSLFRKVVKEKGYEDFENFYRNSNEKLLLELDNTVDMMLVEEAQKKDILIESKIFAGIAEIKDIPCTVKIWITASLHQRILRHMGKGEYKKGFSKVKEYFRVRKNLMKRWNLDSKRYKKLYGIDYNNPKVYNDIVIDSSNINEDETFNLILKMLKDGRYIEKK